MKPQAQTHKITISNSAARLDPINPIPIEHGNGAFFTIDGDKYIPFLGAKDDFFKVILEAKTLSNTHTLCIKSKRDLCAGKGLQMVNGEKFPKPLKDWLKKVNNRGDNDVKLSKKLFNNLFTYGNVPVELVRFTVAGKKYFRVFVHNPLTWRLSWPDEKEGVPLYAINSNLFLRGCILSSELLKDAKIIPLYENHMLQSKQWAKFHDGTERTMFWLTNDADIEHYGLPSSVSSLIYQVKEYKIARYNLDNLDNNMVIGGTLVLKGSLSTNEANRIAREIIKSHTGDGKRGRVCVIASEDGIADSVFHEHNVKTDGSYIELDDRIMQKIILANEWHEMLAGIDRKGGLGSGNTYLYTIYQIKKKAVIDPAQADMIEKAWQPILRLAGEWLGQNNWADLEYTFADIDSVSLLQMIDPSSAVRVNEVREALGLDKDETAEGEKYLSKGGTANAQVPYPEQEQKKDPKKNKEVTK